MSEINCYTINEYTERLEKRIIELEAELARLREATRWIPVGERLPEIGEENDSADVLIYELDGFIYSGYLHERPDDGDKCWVYDNSGSGVFDGAITHWCPLPQPPEVE